MNVFNGTNKFAGYFQAFSGGKAAIKIGRKSAGTGSAIDEGFMVSQYQITAQRGVQLQRFLNVEGVVAQVGILNGGLSLSGLIGTAEGFKKLLGGDNNGNDVCDQLTITITADSGYTKCDENGKATTVNKSAEFVVSGGIVTGVQLTGQVDQAGILMQTGNVTIQFTGLELK